MDSTTGTDPRSPHTVQLLSEESQSRSPHAPTRPLFDTAIEVRSPHVTHGDVVHLASSSSALNGLSEGQRQQEQQTQYEQTANLHAGLPPPPPQYQDLHTQPSPILVSVSDHFIDNNASLQRNQEKDQGSQGVTHVTATPITFVSSQNNRQQCSSKRVKIIITVLLVALAIFLAVMFSTVWKPTGTSVPSGPGPWGACKSGGCPNYQASCSDNCTTNDPTYKKCLPPCNGDVFCESACQNPANNPCFNTCNQNVLTCLLQCGV